MARFAEDSPRLLELVGKGDSMATACDRMGLSYGTARKWVDQGRRNPASAHGKFVAALDAARNPGANEEIGPVETQLDATLRNCDLTGGKALVAAQAKAIAQKIDGLGVGAAAATACAHASRRLEELVGGLSVPREDLVDQLRSQRSQRRGERLANRWTPGDGKQNPPADPTEHSNGKPSREVEIERERPW